MGTKQTYPECTFVHAAFAGQGARIAPDELGLMVKVAELYYRDDLTQQEIAERLGLSRPKVSRLLQRAREAGIVRIDIQFVPGIFRDLERGLETTFGLREAIVVTGEGHRSSLAAVGEAAAGYLDRVLKDGDVLGLSWGTTLGEAVRHLRPRPLAVSVVPLVGGVGQMPLPIHSNDLAKATAARYRGSRCYLMHAPAVVSSPTVREAILSDRNTREVIRRWGEVSLAVVGIGAMVPNSTLIETGYFSPDALQQLATEHGAVGDLCTRFIDAQGRPASGAYGERTIAIELAALARLPTVVGVAAGAAKATAIRAALLGGYLDVLVTDQPAAEAVLEAVESHPAAPAGVRGSGA